MRVSTGTPLRMPVLLTATPPVPGMAWHTWEHVPVTAGPALALGPPRRPPGAGGAEPCLVDVTKHVDEVEYKSTPSRQQLLGPSLDRGTRHSLGHLCQS